MIEYINEFMQINPSGFYQVPYAENIKSIYIQNNSFYHLLLNGLQVGQGLDIYPGKEVIIEGKKNEYFNGKIVLSVYSTFRPQYYITPLITIVLKRVINDKTIQN
jgi:hypothetical protein